MTNLSDSIVPPDQTPCLFCGRVGEHPAGDTCPAANLEAEQRRTREAFAEKQRQLREKGDQAGKRARGDYPLTQAQREQFAELAKHEQGEVSDEALLAALRQAQAEQRQQVDDAQAKADEVARRLLSDAPAPAGPPEGEIPPWLQGYLRDKGIPDAVFQEFRGGARLPDLSRAAERPAESDVLPTPGVSVDATATALRQALPALYAFFTDLDDNVVGMFKSFEEQSARNYLEAGALYGPSQDGLWKWLGEQAEIGRSMTRVNRLMAQQNARREVNTRFPYFWRGEWDVADDPTPPIADAATPQAPAESTPEPPAPLAPLAPPTDDDLLNNLGWS